MGALRARTRARLPFSGCKVGRASWAVRRIDSAPSQSSSPKSEPEARERLRVLSSVLWCKLPVDETLVRSRPPPPRDTRKGDSRTFDGGPRPAWRCSLCGSVAQDRSARGRGRQEDRAQVQRRSPSHRRNEAVARVSSCAKVSGCVGRLLVKAVGRGHARFTRILRHRHVHVDVSVDVPRVYLCICP